MKHSPHPATSALNKTNKEHLAIANLMNTLKQINLNQSWKQSSLKHTHKPKYQQANLMTQNDLDALFNRSKEKSREKESREMHRAKIRTQMGESQLLKYHSTIQNRKKDFTNTKFLRMDNEFDKLLTGLPNGGYADKENMYGGDAGDLTTKFKKDYIIGKVIGEGAYASVRVAVYRPENKKIAIKAYQKSKIRESVRKRTIRRQIKILQLTNHPNIVKIYDVVQSNNHLNIIMQYLPGISLSHAMKQQQHQKFSEHQCRNIMKQLANALSYLHSKNIAHRDIKLENIIIDGEMGIKLIDFGFSTCIEKGTKIKIFCGTPSYMAPEIVQKHQYRGQAADIWALGVMMFVMLIGYFPYKGSSDQELYRKINHADYPQHDISSMRRAHHLIARMFAIDTVNRITAAEILSHPWITDSPMQTTTAIHDLQRKTSKVLPYDLKRLYHSKEKSNSKDPKDYYRQYIPKPDRGDSYSRQKKKSTERTYLTNLNKTHKTLSGKLAATIRPPNKLEKTISNPLRHDKSPKSPSNAHMNRVKIMDFLKLEMKRCSDSLSPVRSHRP